MKISVIILLVVCVTSSHAFTLDFLRARLSSMVNSAKKCYVGEDEKYKSTKCKIDGSAACVTKLLFSADQDQSAIVTKSCMEKNECMQLSDKNKELCPNDESAEGERVCYYCCFTDDCNQEIKIKIVSKDD
ncbi:uncharacterized protein LOC120342581 [Styela clava]